ncbi:MAG TPA: hypothetical protein P5560_09830 [Thermotogota bacterium]|nr:hypothetical protein [Thermotogota bacterium]HRW93233.1 hypothetical protein [Thermotogota bacterium]
MRKKSVTMAILIFVGVCVLGTRVILLVPATMGSTMVESASIIPRLPPFPEDMENLPVPDSLKIHDPWGSVGFSSLKRLLEEDPENIVVEVPYDWRQDFSTTWKTYLKPMIDACKAEHGVRKVDIIAHSMGGLVVRSYIQHEGFENDIDHFIMLGTPNQGYPGIFYILGPVDFHEYKSPPRITGMQKLFSAMLNQLQLKESIIFEQLLKGQGFLDASEELFSSQVDISISPEGFRFVRGDKSLWLSREQVLAQIEQFFPSLFSLLPTYPFLSDETGWLAFDSPRPNELWQMNSGEPLERWLQRVGKAPGQVQAFLFLSDNEKENTLLQVHFPGILDFQTLLSLSQPDFEEVHGSGDGTVPDFFVGQSAFRQFFPDSLQLIRGNFGDHSPLPGNAQVQQHILAILSGQQGQPPENGKGKEVSWTTFACSP